MYSLYQYLYTDDVLFQFFTLLLVLVVLLDLFKAISEYASGQSVPLVLFVSPAVRALSLVSTMQALYIYIYITYKNYSHVWVYEI